MTIAVDFDGTIVEHKYPEIGEELPFATETLKMLIKDQHRLILWSVREGKLLDDAVNWCRERGVEFYAVNRDYPEEEQEKNNHFSRKLKVEMFIDDRNLGGLPDWGQIYHMIHDHKTYNDILRERSSQGMYQEEEMPKKKHWWQF
uniref:Hydrolase n=5 Tax=unclassified Prevotella TaxID=2638335 RepID=A0AB33JPS9_9BACT